MLVTFPHIGPAYLVVSILMKEMGIPFLSPPANTALTLEKGKAVSPEEMCIPFKFMAGNLIQAYEEGARRVLMPATMGPCRLGEYGELLKQVLDKSGYSMEWILLDSPKAIGFQEWIARLHRVIRDRPEKGNNVAVVLAGGFRLIRQLDELEAELKQRAGYAQTPGQCVRMLRLLREELSQQDRLKGAFSVVKKYRKAAARIPIDKSKEPINILVTGEIYTSIESAANQNLEEQLMLLGCKVKRPMTITWWLRHTAGKTLSVSGKKTGTYLPYSIGGYAKETVQEVEHAGEDGIIKIMPAGCMPEIVAKAVCNRIQKEKGVRVLHLVYDEMQGHAGYETRVEAFVDMLERRKGVLSGS